jgi:hypothetical protein
MDTGASTSAVDDDLTRGGLVDSPLLGVLLVQGRERRA